MAKSALYPIAGVDNELPKGSATAPVFDTPDALAINKARMQHLDSLGLPIAGRTVLDVGCGVGNLARFFVERNCSVTCVDARAANIIELKSRSPRVQAYVADVEVDSFTQFGRFDIVFCYGLLYHLENPLAGLRNLAEVCDDLLLLETIVTDHDLPLVRFADEAVETINQALHGMGCRPTPAFVAMALSRIGFDFVYAPVTPPDHPDFQFNWVNDLAWAREGHLLRCIFVASRRHLKNPSLHLLLAAPAERKPGATIPSNLRYEDLCEIAGAVQEIRPSCEHVHVERRTPTRVITPAGRWSYAAAVPLTIPLEGEVWVRVRIRVLQGEGGFGLLNRTGTAFQDRAFVGASTEVRTIFLQVVEAADVECLIIQNSTPDGSAADILLEDVAVLGRPSA